MAVQLTYMYASGPKWTDMFCRLSVEFDQNSVDIPIDTVMSISSTSLLSWCT